VVTAIFENSLGRLQWVCQRYNRLEKGGFRDLGGFKKHQWEGIFGQRYKARLKFGGKGRGTSFMENMKNMKQPGPPP